MRRKLYFAVLLCLMPAALAHAEDLFDIKPMADGVYAAIAKPVYKINCNAAIILLGDSVLVVDTHSKPSAARALNCSIVTRRPRRNTPTSDNGFSFLTMSSCESAVLASDAWRCVFQGVQCETLRRCVDG